MDTHVLIAVPRDILRRGLRTIFAEDLGMACVQEVTNSEELKEQLGTYPAFVVIHQSLVMEMQVLPRHHFIILTSEPDKYMLLEAYARGACGYLLESVSTELLRITLHLSKGECLVDPALASWMLNSFSIDAQSLITNTLLTPREQQICDLRSSGLSNREIAERLCITVNTVKSHISHIARKCGKRR